VTTALLHLPRARDLDGYTQPPSRLHVVCVPCSSEASVTTCPSHTTGMCRVEEMSYHSSLVVSMLWRETMLVSPDGGTYCVSASF